MPNVSKLLRRLSGLSTLNDDEVIKKNFRRYTKMKLAIGNCVIKLGIGKCGFIIG